MHKQHHVSWRAALLLLLTLLGVLSPWAHTRPAGAAGPAVPVSETSYQVYLPLIASAGSGGGQPGGATSDALIAAALKRGEIDDETALLYRVFAAFADARLPAQYRGDDSQLVGGPLMFEVQGRFASLTPATQAALQPFLLPPSAPGSWLELDAASQRLTTATAAPAATVAWATTCATSSHIKVWYHANVSAAAGVARTICDEMERTVWPKLTGLMGRGPLSDANEPNNGGSEKFDIYLVERGQSMTMAYSGSTYDQRPAYMVINRSRYQREDLARLVMEAIVYGYKMVGVGVDISYEVLWDLFATPIWAIDFVYPDSNREQAYAQAYLDQTDNFFPGIGTEGYAAEGDLNQGRYLWPFYLARYGATPQAIAETWELGEQQSHLTAMNAAIGGFEDQWPEFARFNWNRDPVPFYQADDSLSAQAKPQFEAAVALDGAPSKHYAMPAQVLPLAAEYYHFTFPDASARSVLVTNPFANGTFPYARVAAMYYTPQTKTWHEIPRLDQQYMSFCRDLIAERMTDLVIIVSNSDWRGQKKLEPPQPMTLDATDVGCRGWEVEAETTVIDSGPTWERTSVVKTSATFELDQPRENLGVPVEFYDLTSGTATWTHSGYTGACAGSGNGTYDVRNPDVAYSMIMETYGLPYGIPTVPPASAGTRRYTALGVMPASQPLPQVTYTCPGGYSSERAADVFLWLQTEPPGSPLMQHGVGDDGQTIEGSTSWTDYPQVGTVTQRVVWKMTALPPE